jgi:hypothetical protein
VDYPEIIYTEIENTTPGEWEELGRDISNNTYLETLEILHNACDDHRMSSRIV